ncbi:probable aldo-keto reductase (AKR13), puatative [Phialocephala subalpina]|uniref:Probable aldo-keto reductase (AKR13), puatative n=1 Tax=Phialocephala subalpina TaxID=576137 RepID=A0A1L7WGF3_9HELO|nr:probable aldo-keto reductase (AKR13), puatative [Phialocephala subalpina]
MSKLPTSQLGKNGPLIPKMGLGCMGLSIWYGAGAIPDEERLQFLDGAFELGETFWVTSDRYGDNEALLAKWFKRTGQRSSIFLCDKFGLVPSDDILKSEILRTDPEWTKQACANSLKTLGVDKIDLYMAHRVDDVTPIEKTVEAMIELKNEGKIDYIGFSEISAASLRRACAVHQISAVEVEFSPFSLEIESEQINLLKTCRELGVAVVAYSPLGRGLMAGQIKSLDDLGEKDARRIMPRFSAENFPKNLKLVEDLEKIAEKKGCTPGQLTLAWLMAEGDDIFPIPGTTKVSRLEENLGALKVVLTQEEIKEIRTVVDAAEVYGARYPEAFASMVFRDTPPLV